MSKYVYRFRLYPKKNQIEFLNKQIGRCRFAYNKVLEIAKENYRKEGEKWNYYEYKKLLPKLKEEYPFLKEANSQSLQESVKQLDRAFKSFFKGLTKFPKFKSKKKANGISIPQHFRIEGNRIKIPKLKTPIRFIKHRGIEGEIKSVSITKTPTGKFYLNVLTERDFLSLPPSGKAVGIDVGISSFCVLSDGTKIENPKNLIRTEEKLKKLQRRLSKKIKGSNNYKKLKLKIAKLHEKIKNQRNDFLHKVSKKIIGDNQAVFVENLNINDMLKNRRLAKFISDAAWDRFITFLEYKARWYGRKLVKTERFYPSSKTCSRCGYVNHDLKLSDRVWVCPECGTVHDRDLNAARNILKKGLTRLRVVGTGCPELRPAST